MLDLLKNNLYQKNQECLHLFNQVLPSFSSYLVLNEQGSPDSSWWNNNGSVPGYIDFTNPDAANWFSERLQNLIETYDIDTLKFDAGESSWSPQVNYIFDRSSIFVQSTLNHDPL